MFVFVCVAAGAGAASTQYYHKACDIENPNSNFEVVLKRT